MAKNEINILDLLIILLKNKATIIKYVLTITILALIISLVWPKTYKSTVQFFPPPSEKLNLGGIFDSFFQSAPTTSKLSSEALLVVLQSRMIKEKVIKKFKLDSIFGYDVIEHNLKKLDTKIEVEETREGGFGFNPVVSVEFSYSDKVPARTMAVTDYYVFLVDSVLRELNYERVYRSFKNLEKRYLQNIEDLENAEEALEQFQKKYGVYEIESQLKTMIEKIAELKAESIQLEIQINVLKNTVTKDNPQLQELINQKNEMDRAYNELLQKSQNYQPDKLFHPLSEVPELVKRYGRLFREVTIQTKVLEVIYPQYEQIKLQVDSDPLGIQVLDVAKLPTYKDKPKRAIIVIAGFLFALFLSFIVIFIRENYLNEDRVNSETVARVREVRDHLARLMFWKKNDK